jgi:hypothetical protein
MRRKVSNVRAVSQGPGATRFCGEVFYQEGLVEQLPHMIRLFQVSLYFSSKSEEWRRVRNKTVRIATSPRTQVETSERLSVSHQNLHFDFRTRGYWVSGLGHCSAAGHLLTKQLYDSPGLPIIRGRLGQTRVLLEGPTCGKRPCTAYMQRYLLAAVVKSPGTR